LRLGIPGDSGAWVVESGKGRVAGCVLAWSERKRVAYICPMDVLIDDIAQTCEAEKVALGNGVVLIGSETATAAMSEDGDWEHADREMKRIKDFDTVGSDEEDSSDDADDEESDDENYDARTIRSLEKTNVSSPISPLKGLASTSTTPIRILNNNSRKREKDIPDLIPVMDKMRVGGSKRMEKRILIDG